jgi:hypothetical protein
VEGINLLALKLRAAGFGLDRTELAWLHKLNRANLATWEKGSNRGYGSDLLSDDWARCGKPHANLSDPTSGGDTGRSAELLAALAPKR